MKKLSSSSTCTNLFRSGLDKAKPAFLRIEPELQAMFDRARKQEPVQIFAKAEDSRDPAVVYAQVRWSCIHERFDLKFINWFLKIIFLYQSYSKTIVSSCQFDSVNHSVYLLSRSWILGYVQIYMYPLASFQLLILLLALHGHNCTLWLNYETISGWISPWPEPQIAVEAALVSAEGEMVRIVREAARRVTNSACRSGAISGRALGSAFRGKHWMYRLSQVYLTVSLW